MTPSGYSSRDASCGRCDAADSEETGMYSRLIAGLLLATALASNPALACKGQTVLAADDFTAADPAWNPEWGEVTVSDGKLQVKSNPGMIAMVWYETEFFPGADACIDF